MAGRNNQLMRVLTVLKILEGAPQGLTTKEIWERVKERGHEGSKRTIYRDLQALQGVNCPISTDGEVTDENSRRWKLERTTRMATHFVLSWQELLALYFARGVLAPLRESPFYEALNSTFQRIESTFGSESKKYFAELNQEIQFEPGPRWGLGLDPDILETVRACCAEKQILSAEYSSANGGDKRVRKLGAHYLYFAKGSMYLVAEDLESKSIKVFAVPRFSSAEMTDKPYMGTIEDPEKFFESSFGVYRGGKPQMVKVEFSSKVAPYIKERRWHTSQRVVSKEGGTIVVSFEVDLTPELISWVLGFGSEAVVLEPQSLIERLAKEASEVCKLYKNVKAA